MSKNDNGTLKNLKTVWKSLVQTGFCFILNAFSYFSHHGIIMETSILQPFFYRSEPSIKTDCPVSLASACDPELDLHTLTGRLTLNPSTLHGLQYSHKSAECLKQ